MNAAYGMRFDSRRAFRKSRGFLVFAVIAAFGSMATVGCSDDGDNGGTGPDLITVEDLVGTWTATQYTFTSNDNPALSLDLVALGGAFTWIADASGNFTGEVLIPPIAGGPMTLPFQGSYSLVGQDSLQVTFNPEIPPLLTSGQVGFDLSGNTATIVDNDESFDFDDDGNDESATVVAVLVRS